MPVADEPNIGAYQARKKEAKLYAVSLTDAAKSVFKGNVVAQNRLQSFAQQQKIDTVAELSQWIRDNDIKKYADRGLFPLWAHCLRKIGFSNETVLSIFAQSSHDTKK